MDLILIICFKATGSYKNCLAFRIFMFYVFSSIVSFTLIMYRSEADLSMPDTFTLNKLVQPLLRDSERLSLPIEEDLVTCVFRQLIECFFWIEGSGISGTYSLGLDFYLIEPNLSDLLEKLFFCNETWFLCTDYLLNKYLSLISLDSAG